MTIGEWVRKTSRPPGRSRRAASGIQSAGSHHRQAPYSEKARSKPPSGEGHGLRAGVDEREVEPVLALEPAGRLELPGGVVDACRAGPPSGEPGRPVGRPAPELDDLEARDVGQHTQRPLRDPPDAPYGVVHRPLALAISDELVGEAIPDLAVDAGVPGEAVGPAGATTAPAPGGDQGVALGDERPHQVVAGVAAQRHREPVTLVEVVARDDGLVRLAQLLRVVGVALDAHLQGLVRERRQGEHLPARP